MMLAVAETMAVQVVFAALVVTQLLHATSVAANQLKVGLYNEIPDLGGDELASYKSMIEDGFSRNSPGNMVDAVVDKAQYTPYGDLKKYLEEDEFDLLEIDTATLSQLVEDNLVLEVPRNEIPEYTLPAALDAVRMNRHLYAYPTLACGNFLVGLTPGSEDACPLRDGRVSYDNFHHKIKHCTKDLLPGSNYRRIFGGKMNGKYGWYLPFLYLDGYIDVHGPASVEKAVDEVTNGILDLEVCRHLRWCIHQCNDKDDKVPNKCYKKFEGSYVEDSNNVYTDIANNETMFFFGFSEKVAEIETVAGISPYAAISGPLGELNHLLQFTDALVINKARWESASQEKKNAIKAFCQYFLGVNLRRQISLGEDLTPPQTRYLLQASESFYSVPAVAKNVLYQDYYWLLKRAVAAPSLSDYQKERMQEVLSTECVAH